MRKFKLIIAGSRSARVSEARIHRDLKQAGITLAQIECVVSGGATGIDACGEAFARLCKLPCKVFPADWRAHGDAAGPIRNRAMLDWVGVDGIVLAYPVGVSKGTWNMITEAKSRSVPTFVSDMDRDRVTKWSA